MGWTLAVLAFAQLIFALDLNIVFVALPDIGRDLGFTRHTLQWVVGAYTVFGGGFLLLGGRIADVLGRRRTFVAALLLYGGSSLVGGLARTPELVVVARAVQGIGAALLLPSTLSLVNTLFEEGRPRNRALAVWGGAGASGLTLGALLGGVLTEAFGWSAVFYVNVPLAGLVVLAALRVIPADPVSAVRRRFDVPGAVTVTAGATLLVLVLVQGPKAGWTSPSILLAAAAAAALLGAFAMIELRSRDPLMPPSLIGNRSLRAAGAVTFLYMASFGALPYFLTVLFQTVRGASALETGLAFLLPSLAIAAGTQLGERITTRIGARRTLTGGFAAGAAGTAVLALAFGEDASYAAAVPGLLLSGLAQGVVWTAMWIAAAEGVESHEQGVAAGMASTMLNVGNAIGLAILIAIANGAADDRVASGATAAIADGSRIAVLVAAAAMLLGVLIAFALPRREAGGTAEEAVPDVAAQVLEAA